MESKVIIYHRGRLRVALSIIESLRILFRNTSADEELDTIYYAMHRVDQLLKIQEEADKYT